MQPILFRLPLLDIPVYAYGGMLALSLLVAWILIMRVGARRGHRRSELVGAFTWTAVAALVGARLLFVVANWHELQAQGPLAWLDPRGAGLVAYGGFLGGLLGASIYLRGRSLALLDWADLVTPTLGSGLLLTRVGCWLQGCCFGGLVPREAPAWVRSLALEFPNWRLRFPELTELGAGAPAFVHHVRLGLVSADSPVSLPVYPTQPLESGIGLGAFLLTLVVLARRRFPGQVLLVFGIYYGVLRAALEVLRGDPFRGGVGPLSTSQLLGLGTALLAAVAWPLLVRRARQSARKTSSS